MENAYACVRVCISSSAFISGIDLNQMVTARVPENRKLDPGLKISCCLKKFSYYYNCNSVSWCESFNISGIVHVTW